MNNIRIKSNKGIPMIVFHGTIYEHYISLKNGINLNKSKEKLDFGKGFYTTSDYRQAVEFAKSRTNKYNNFEDTKHSFNNAYIQKYTKPLVLHYIVDVGRLEKLNGKFFNKPDDTWKEFVYNNRRGINNIISDNHNLDCKYDFIYGCVADSDVEAIIKKKMDSFKNIDSHFEDQLSFHTESAIKCLQMIEEGDNYEERIS